MDVYYENFLISDNKKLLQLDRIHALLSKTYWAESRPKEVVKKSIENSLCFGVYEDGLLIGFARCVTDYAVVYWLCDVIIAKEHQGKGLGKVLVKAIMEHESLASLKGILATKDAHGLYEKFGFERKEGFFMVKFV